MGSELLPHLKDEVLRLVSVLGRGVNSHPLPERIPTVQKRS